MKCFFLGGVGKVGGEAGGGVVSLAMPVPPSGAVAMGTDGVASLAAAAARCAWRFRLMVLLEGAIFKVEGEVQ